MCLGIVSGCEVEPVVALRLRTAAEHRLPTFGPHGTKLGHSWYQWIIKIDFLAGFTILKKERCLGIVGGCGPDPAVALHLKNAADYRLPTFGPHGTKLGHSWYQWIIKSDLSGWFDNSKKGEVSGQIEWIGGSSRGCTPPKECCRLPPTYFWTTWHQTRAFLKSVNNKSDFSGWFDNSKKGEVSGQIEWMGGWSRGCTPPKECCRLPHSYFWTTWRQNRAFLISVNNKKWSFWLVWQFWKRRCVWGFWTLAGVIPWLHSTSRMLPTTAYLLLDHEAPN